MIRVKAAFFSLTPPAPPGDDGSSLRSRQHLEAVGNVVNYLVGDPVQQTHDDFMQLGPRLAEVGRFPEVRASLQLRTPGRVPVLIEQRWRSDAVRPVFAGPLRTMIEREAWR